jgi:hypothetical protein
MSFSKEKLFTDGKDNPYSNNFYWVHSYWRSLCPDLGFAKPLQLFQGIEAVRRVKGMILRAGEWVLFRMDSEKPRLVLGFIMVPTRFQKEIKGLVGGVIKNERWIAFTCSPGLGDHEDPHYIPVIQMVGVRHITRIEGGHFIDKDQFPTLFKTTGAAFSAFLDKLAAVYLPFFTTPENM